VHGARHHVGASTVTFAWEPWRKRLESVKPDKSGELVRRTRANCLPGPSSSLAPRASRSNTLGGGAVRSGVLYWGASLRPTRRDTEGSLTTTQTGLSLEELEAEVGEELPARELMVLGCYFVTVGVVPLTGSQTVFVCATAT
jgi:hypothetical protein